MSYLGIYTFGENSTSVVRDYSAAAKDATEVTGITITDGDRSKAAVFDGSAEIAFGNSFNNTTATFSATVKFKYTTSQSQTIFSKDGQFSIFLTAGNELRASIDAGGTQVLVGSTLTINTWYTVTLNYDGTNIKLWENGIEAASQAHSTVMDSSTADVTLGFYRNGGDSDHFIGQIEYAEARDSSTSTTEAELVALKNHIGGYQVTLRDASKHTVGDLLEDYLDSNVKYVITYISSNTVHLLPFGSAFYTENSRLVTIGHRWDENRMQTIKFEAATGYNGADFVVRNVKDFADYTDDTKKIIQYGSKGIKYWQKNISSDTTLDCSYKVVEVDSSSGVVTVKLPASPDDYQEYEIIAPNASTNNVTIDGNGKKILGSTTGTLTTDDESWTLRYNGTEWKLR